MKQNVWNSFIRPREQWFQRVIRSPKLIIHLFVLIFISATPLFVVYLGIQKPHLLYRGLWLILVVLSTYLLNVYYCMPRFFYTKKFKTYFLWVGLFMATTIIIDSSVIKEYFKLRTPVERTIRAKIQKSRDKEHRSLYRTWRRYSPTHWGIAFPIVFALVASISIEATGKWMEQEEKRKESEHQRTASELAFLKSQMNPHFLFNTLNNIYSLAATGSDQVETAVLKLSQLMRYMLYESNVDKIALSKEVSYLQNYVDLQRMRISAKKNIDIHFEVHGQTERIQIEPLLLLPFVENAFKHGLSYTQKARIDIYLEAKPGEIYFQVSNYKSDKPTEIAPAASGIGLKNVKRRLELAYGKHHVLLIQEEKDQYLVKLKITNL